MWLSLQPFWGIIQLLKKTKRYLRPKSSEPAQPSAGLGTISIPRVISDAYYLWCCFCIGICLEICFELETHLKHSQIQEHEHLFFFSFSKIFDIRPLANAIADGWSWDCLPVSVVVFMHSWSWHWPTMVLFNQPYTSFSQQLHTVMQQLPLYASFLSHKKIRSSTTPESLYYYHYLWNQSFKPSWISTKADFDIHRSRCPASTSWEPLACGEIWQQSAELAFREFSPNIGVSQEPQVEGQIRLFCMWI